MNKTARQNFMCSCQKGGQKKELNKYFALLKKLGENNKKYQKMYMEDKEYLKQNGGFFGTMAQRTPRNNDGQNDMNNIGMNRNTQQKMKTQGNIALRSRRGYNNAARKNIQGFFNNNNV